MPRAPEQVARRAAVANGATNICGSAPSPYPTDPAAAFVQQCALGAVHIGAGVGLLWLAGAAALFQATREMMEV
jgi:hypothetical protein